MEPKRTPLKHQLKITSLILLIGTGCIFSPCAAYRVARWFYTDEQIDTFLLGWIRSADDLEDFLDVQVPDDASNIQVYSLSFMQARETDFRFTTSQTNAEIFAQDVCPEKTEPEFASKLIEYPPINYITATQWDDAPLNILLEYRCKLGNEPIPVVSVRVYEIPEGKAIVHVHISL